MSQGEDVPGEVDLLDKLNGSDDHWKKLKLQRISYQLPDEFIKKRLQTPISGQHSSNITKVVSEQILKSLQQYLKKNTKIGKGQFIPIGSTFSGFNTSQNRDFDFLYVCPWPKDCSLKINAKEKKPFVKIYAQGKKFDVRKVQDYFRKCIEEALCNISFPKHFTFSGYGRPKFNGTRQNGPAITCLLEDDRDQEKVISIDMTYTFQIPNSRRSELFSHLRSLDSFKDWSKADENPDGVHIVPYINQQKNKYSWQLTTAVLETKLPRDPAVVNIIRTIKELASDLSLKSSRQVFDAIKVHPDSLQLLRDLQQHQLEGHVQTKAELGTKLFHKHVFLPNFVEPMYHEKTKEIFSISSAAVKFYVFGQNIKDSQPLNTERSIKLIKDFFQRLPTSVNHPFLCCDVKLVNLAPYAVKEIRKYFMIFKSRIADML